MTLHAMRVAARSDRDGRRATICGALAKPMGRPYSGIQPAACATCTVTLKTRPPRRPLRVSADLATLRHELDQAGIAIDRNPQADHRQLLAHLVAVA
jgi:hypothetical protein